MRHPRFTPPAAIVPFALVALLAACSSPEAPPDGAAANAGGDAPAATAPGAAPSSAGAAAEPPMLSSSGQHIGGMGDGGGELPAGHPPIDAAGGGAGMMGAGGISAGTPTAELAWTVPAGWQEVPPTSGMRRAQFRVPGAAGDAELVVFAFGPGQGGDVQANAQRWASQFKNAQGQPATGDLRTTQATVAGMPVTRVEVGGTYDGGMAMLGSGKALTDYRLLGAIVETPGGAWFFKLTGPAATIEAQRGAFDAFVASLHAA